MTSHVGKNRTAFPRAGPKLNVLCTTPLLCVRDQYCKRSGEPLKSPKSCNSLPISDQLDSNPAWPFARACRATMLLTKVLNGIATWRTN